MRLYSVGHGTASEEAFVRLLARGGIKRIIDVRTAPGSRRFPWFRREEMERWLPPAGVTYRWEKELGGFRRADPSSPNVALRNDGFRGYADHMRTPAFVEALDRVIVSAAAQPTTVMCSESLWWRCHRRLFSDAAVMLRGVEVVHLSHDGGLAQHVPTEGVRTDRDLLVYDAGQGRFA